MPVLSCPRCKARVEIAADATQATCHACGFSAPRRAPAAAGPAPAPGAPRPAAPAAPGAAAPAAAVAQTAHPATAPQAVPTRAAPAPARKPARKDNPQGTLLVAAAASFALWIGIQAVVGSIYFALFVGSIFTVPILTGWLGGRLTPGDRLTRTVNAAGGNAVGTLLGFFLSTVLLRPILQNALGEVVPYPPIITVLTPTLVLTLVSAALAAVGAWFLAEPEQPRKKPAGPK